MSDDCKGKRTKLQYMKALGSADLGMIADYIAGGSQNTSPVYLSVAFVIRVTS